MVLVFLNIYLTRHLRYPCLRPASSWAPTGWDPSRGGYLGGMLIDKIGIRPVMLASLILSAVTLIVAGYVTAFIPL